MRQMFFVLVFAMLAVMPALAQPVTFGKFAEPADAELARFPIKQAPLTLAEQAGLGLSAKKLEVPVVVMNYFRNVKNGRFVLETLPTGTLVLVDKDGHIRYKADCGNRLVEIKSCPQPEKKMFQAFDPGSVKNSLGKKTNAQSFSGSGPGAWSRFWDNAEKAWTSGWGGVGSLLGFLPPLLVLLFLLALLAGAIYGFSQAIRNWRRAANPPPQPVVPPAQVAPASTTVPPVQQAGVNPPVPPPPQPAVLVPPQLPVQPTSGVIQPNPAAPQGRKFRFTTSGTGIYSRMEGYQNLRVEENATGISINADRV